MAFIFVLSREVLAKVQTLIEQRLSRSFAMLSMHRVD